MALDTDVQITIPAFTGTLHDLVRQVQRGDIPVDAVPVDEVSRQCRKALEEDKGDIDRLAGALASLHRLLDYKLTALEGALKEPEGEPELPLQDLLQEEEDALREQAYRAFKDAASRLFEEHGADGYQSFMSLVTPDVIPVSSVVIQPDRLIAAFQAVLDRIQSLEFVTRPIPIIPVDTMMTSLRETFRVQARWSFHDLFVTVTSKNEAIARFLALLELIKCGEVQVEDGPTIQLVAAGSRNE